MRRRRARPDEFDLIARDATPDCDAVQILKAKLYSTADMLQSLPTGAADFSVKCGDYLWGFHKDTLAAKSDYFRVLTRPDFRESNQGVIDLSEEEPQLIVRLFQWAYAGKYGVSTYAYVVDGMDSVNEVCEKGWQKDMKDFELPFWGGGHGLLHLNMYVMADYYLVPDMVKYCLRKFEEALMYKDSAEEIFACIEAMETLQNLPEDKLNKVLSPLVQGARRKVFTKEQRVKIMELAKVFPMLVAV